MSEEEKEAINNLRFYSTNVGFSKYDGTACLLRARDVQILLNLIGKQQKELDNLKEIEQEHKEENGKLRVELQQEKEKNKELSEKLVEKICNGVEEQVLEEYRQKLVNSISKDKIKQEIKELENMQVGGEVFVTAVNFAIKILKELLEEELQ